LGGPGEPGLGPPEQGSFQDAGLLFSISMSLSAT
jgi:hypothetical protein